MIYKLHPIGALCFQLFPNSAIVSQKILKAKEVFPSKSKATTVQGTLGTLSSLLYVPKTDP